MQLDCSFDARTWLLFDIALSQNAVYPCRMLISQSASWKKLLSHLPAVEAVHLRDLLRDEGRARAMRAEFDGIYLDYSRQRATTETMQLLHELAKEAGLAKKMAAMAAGEPINRTENRAVMHMALRSDAKDVHRVGGENVVPMVHRVLDQIRTFSSDVRHRAWGGATGKPLVNVVSIGIGGSYLGPEFAHEAFRTDLACSEAAHGRRLRFLANVDPVDVARALEGLDPEQTLVVVVSKTFTTAETMLNARTLRDWLVRRMGADCVRKHMVAVSTNLKEVTAFGIDPKNAFAFWDWVGGRYSVTSAVGVLPLALQYGMPLVEKFLAGARAIDRHFVSAPHEANLPVLMGLLGVWNSSFLGYGSRALLPYAQALLKLAPHIQQVDMESNGKGVSSEGEALDFEAGEVNFGEPGTNGQHSFYQLIHQGRVIPCDFIGFKQSQQPLRIEGEEVSNHDELMANFFAQPDALAYGKTVEELRREGVPEPLLTQKAFSGNRPSLSLLLPRLDSYTTGQLLALYEHRTAVQGFIWGINSFDQWGVELGKVLAKQIRSELVSMRKKPGSVPAEHWNPSTRELLRRFVE